MRRDLTYQAGHFDRSNRTRTHRAKLLIAVSAVLGCVSFVGWHANAAQASTADFCPPTINSMMYLGAGQSCVSAIFYNLTKVTYVTSNGDGVDHCAVGKQNADGGGANVIPAACGMGYIQSTPCVSARVGYAKGENRTTSGHYFWGFAYYYDCSV